MLGSGEGWGLTISGLRMGLPESVSYCRNGNVILDLALKSFSSQPTKH
jgi:hypothetical protein